MALNETWHLRSRSRECAATGTPFTEGQPIITAIFPDPESSGYLRKDFCDDAWNARTEDEEQAFSSWRTKFQLTTVTEDSRAVTKQSAEELLRSLVEEDQDHTENTRYILAVMLERQKLLKETDTQPTAGGILRIYEHRKTGEVFIVKDPNIPLDQVEKVQAEVFALLSPQPVPIPEQTVEQPTEEAPEETQEEAPEETPVQPTEEALEEVSADSVS